jgi:hypothetical protein
MTEILKARSAQWLSLLLPMSALLAIGCQSTPMNTAEGTTPLRSPRAEQSESYEDSLSGGEVFAMYCNQCHNARALGERPLSNYQNVAAHMRVRANLTGVEYTKLQEFLRRWNDVTPPTPPVEPSPKRLIYGQPINELRDEIAPSAATPAQAKPDPAVAQPQPTGPQPLPPR